MHSGFTNAQDALSFILGGNATVTLVSKKTGQRFTYKIRQKTTDEGDVTPFFVSVLSGPDNGADYQYIGFIPTHRLELVAGRKGKPSAPSFKAFDWVIRQLSNGSLHPMLDIYHEGKCAACGRALTVPASIESGFGPECSKKKALAA